MTTDPTHTTCLFINLDTSTARRDHMINQFTANGLKATRIAAVDGSQLDHDECNQLNPRRYGWQVMSKGEIGCFLSHRKAWKRIADGNQRHVAVFEDDIKLAIDAADCLSDLSWVDPDCDLIKLDTSEGKILITDQRDGPGRSRSLVRIHSAAISTAGYIISRHCAQRLFDATKTLPAPVDLYLFNPKYRKQHRLTPWQLMPAICVQQAAHETEYFLSGDAEISAINAGRSATLARKKQIKPNRLNKLRRELSRPFIRLANRMETARLIYWGKGSWADLNFRE